MNTESIRGMQTPSCFFSSFRRNLNVLVNLINIFKESSQVNTFDDVMSFMALRVKGEFEITVQF